MKEGTLYIAPPGARDKNEILLNEIVLQCPANDFSSVTYVAPNNFILSTAQDRFFSYLKKSSNRAGYIPFQALTIKQLASELHEKYSGGTVISDHLRTLILCRILKAKNTGYPRLLSGLSKKIKHYIADNDLTGLKEKIGQLIFEEKAADRALQAVDVLGRYEQELESGNILDPDSMLKNSIPLIREHISPALLVIDGFYDPTPLETNIISALIEKSDTVYILADEGTEILNHFRTSAPGLKTVRLKPAVQRKKSGYHTYPSMEDEVAGIAANIKKLIIEGVAPREITVCFPVLSKYLPMLRRIFRKFGIPASIGEYNLSNSRPFAAVNEIITCMEEDYPRNDFLSLLTSPCFPAVPEIVKERAVSYSYRAGIVKGKTAWLSIRDILLNSGHQEISADEKKKADEFQKGIERIIGILENLKKQKQLLSFADTFENVLNTLGFFDSPALSGPGVQGEDISGAVSKQLSELRQFAGLCSPGRVDAETPAFYLRFLLQNIKGAETDRDGVKIIPYELAAGCETTALFLGGMLEGDFPSRPGIDPILPEKVKKALGMPYLEYYLKRQKSYFNRLLNVSVHEPFCTCPAAEGDKIFLPSPFLDWEEKLNPLILNMFTEEDVLIREGEIRPPDMDGQAFRDRKIFTGKYSLDLLHRRISAVFKGVISVTSIDYYRKCPLRFYIEKILGLDIEMPPKYEVESRLWGTLAHRTMEHLFKEGDINLDLMDDKISQGLEKSLKQFPVGDFWAKVAKEIFRKLVPMLKEQEIDIRQQGFSPHMTEEKLTADLDGIKLRGKIDRVDRKQTEDRGQTGEGSQRITDNGHGHDVILIDYKTGAVDSDSLQMPLYAYLWNSSFPEPVEKTGYYSLKEGTIQWAPKKKSMDEFMRDAVEITAGLIKDMNNGLFGPEPFKPNECRYCQHSPLCRK